VISAMIRRLSLLAATLLVATAIPVFCAVMAEEPSESNDNRSDMASRWRGWFASAWWFTT